MTVAEYKTKWVADRRAELHARGMTDAAIARQMGYKPPYVSQVFNGDSVGDVFIDKMCSAFGFRFLQAAEIAQRPNAADGVPPELLRELIAQGKRNNNIMDLLFEGLTKWSRPGRNSPLTVRHFLLACMYIRYTFDPSTNSNTP